VKRQILEFLHKFLQCELGRYGTLVDVLGQQNRDRALISLGILEPVRRLETSVDVRGLRSWWRG
jgi:hypothetical protein